MRIMGRSTVEKTTPPNARRRVGFTELRGSLAKGLPLVTVSVALVLTGCSDSTPPQPVAKLTAADLYTQYQENSVRADQRYEDKWIEVSGIITGIGSDILGTPYITLGVGGADGWVQALFRREDAPIVAKLKKDTPIVVRCRGKGKLLNVMLDQCRLANF